jgi:hypothetical protein
MGTSGRMANVVFVDTPIAAAEGDGSAREITNPLVRSAQSTVGLDVTPVGSAS